MVTLASEIKEREKLKDENIVKIAMTKCNKNIFKAIYFSRLPIPYKF